MMAYSHVLLCLSHTPFFSNFFQFTNLSYTVGPRYMPLRCPLSFSILRYNANFYTCRLKRRRRLTSKSHFLFVIFDKRRI